MTDERRDLAADTLRAAKELIGAGNLDAAEASLRRALSIAPETAELLVYLAMFLLTHRKSAEGLQLLLPQLERRPTWMVKTAFANCLARAVFVTDEPRVRAALTAAIREPWTYPNVLRPAALSLLMLDPGVSAGVRLVNAQWPARVPKTALLARVSLARLATDPLLHALLECAPVNSIEFERFLVAMRSVLLETAASAQPPNPADSAGLRFYAALARQCFINEYLFDCDDNERATAESCRTRLLALLGTQAELPPLLLLAVAAYYPLFTLPEPDRLLSAAQPGPIDELLRQQVSEPLQEQLLRAQVTRLTSISHGVSERVREQYEQNPYPRWLRLPIHDLAQTFNDELRQTFPLARFAPLPDEREPQMLIAGCGSGTQAIFSALRYRGVRVLAVDLSLSSLCYAMRKTQELGVTNIEYAQADILQLGDIGRSFDIIASVGVLHHLTDPFLGWRALLALLRPGGFMQLALYSELGRRRLVAAREFIAARGYADTPEGIRRFRRDVCARDASAELQWLTTVPDFYSISECRDMLFHVQEHRLTIDQIESFLRECGLHFLGFELRPAVLQRYRARFPDDTAGVNLRNWALFERDNPDTFAEMYHFWIQRPTHEG